MNFTSIYFGHLRNFYGICEKILEILRYFFVIELAAKSLEIFEAISFITELAENFSEKIYAYFSKRRNAPRFCREFLQKICGNLRILKKPPPLKCLCDTMKRTRTS